MNRPATNDRLKVVSLMLKTRPRKSSSISCWSAVSVTIFMPWVARLIDERSRRAVSASR